MGPPPKSTGAGPRPLLAKGASVGSESNANSAECAQAL